MASEPKATRPRIVVMKIARRRAAAAFRSLGTRATALVLTASLASSAAAGAASTAGSRHVVRDAPRYVAMGSSYASGPGVGTYDASSGACARSTSNYARLFAVARGYELVDVSCSGATIRDVLVGSESLPPQIDAVDRRTRLVTVTIGGNDVGYMADLLGRSCRDEAITNGTSAAACEVLPSDEVTRRFAALPADLLAVASAIRSRSPSVMIVFVEYLPALPGAGTCPQRVPLAPADADAMRATYDRLTTDFVDAASRSGALLVRDARIGTGHDACSASPFVAQYHPAVTPGWDSPVPYHPNQAGMSAVAAALKRLLPERR